MHCEVIVDQPPTVDLNDPDLARKTAEALAALKILALASVVLTVTDSGNANGGEGGGNQPLVTCAHPHGLVNPGDRVVLTGTGYDGEWVIEPAGDDTFLIDDVAFTGPTTGGTWRRA